MLKILPVTVFLALGLGGCSSVSDITGAFGGNPRPQVALADEGEFVRAPAQRPSRRIQPGGRSQLPPPPDHMAGNSFSNYDVPSNDFAGNDGSDDVIAPPASQSVSKKRLAIRPLGQDAESDAPVIKTAKAREEAPATGPMRFNVASARNQINSYRDSEGLVALRLDSDLMRAAKAQSDAMAKNDSMDHAIGGSFAKRMGRVGIRDVAAAENIAAGYANVSSVIRGWQASDAHDANLKMKEATRMGIAATASSSNPDKLYWTLIVAGD
jgi:uncharacterized protein YkwD